MKLNLKMNPEIRFIKLDVCEKMNCLKGSKLTIETYYNLCETLDFVTTNLIRENLKNPIQTTLCKKIFHYE